jgi:hypothetical protein
MPARAAARLVAKDNFLISWPPQPDGDRMFLDHPTITATNSQTGPDRIERLDRVHGYAF